MYDKYKNNNNIESTDEYNLKFAKWEEQFKNYQDTNKKLQRIEEDIYIDKIAFIDYVRTLSAYINNNLDYLSKPTEFKNKIKEFNSYIYSVKFTQDAMKQNILKQKGAIDQLLPDEEYLKKIEDIKEINADVQHELTIRGIKIRVDVETITEEKTNKMNKEELEILKFLDEKFGGK